MPSASSGVARAASKPRSLAIWNTQTLPSWCELLVDRHAAEQVGGAVGDRAATDRGTARRRWRGFVIVFIRSFGHPRTAPAVRPPMI